MIIKKIWRDFVEEVLSKILYVAILFGFLFLAFGYTKMVFEEPSPWQEIFKVCGTVILSSGVFMAIAKSHQFTNIFKDELRKVIFSDEHLDERSDLEKIWENVSEAMCRRKFSVISKKLQKNIKDFYLPINQDFYFKDYNYEIDISYYKEDCNYLCLEETTEATIISHDKEKVNYKFSTTIPFPSDDNNITSYDLKHISINGKVVDVKKILNIEKRNGKLLVDFVYPLSGSLSYTIKKIEEKRYHQRSNPYKGHEAAWIYQNFFLDLTYPKEMEIEFINMGLLKKFGLDFKPLDNLNRLKAKYTGLIFPRQGFLIIFNKT